MKHQFLVKSRHYENGIVAGDIGEQIVKAKTVAQARDKVLRCGKRVVVETPTPFNMNDYGDFLRRIKVRKANRLLRKEEYAAIQ